MSNSPKRFISKVFYCQNCKNSFKKLVGFKITESICPKCNYDSCKIKEEKNIKEEEKEDKLRKHILSLVKPFSISPFSKSIVRSHIDFSDILDDQIITTPTEDFFIDNYSSNFISNFFNPMSRIVYVQLQKNNFKNENSLPLNTKQIKQIKKFNLKEYHCKKLDDNKFEYPNCLFCLKDIVLNENTFLLRCGHLYHKDCIYNWVLKHSICPFCKFDIISKSNHKSSIDIVNERDNQEDYNVKKTLRKEKENNVEVKKNSNINILGENKDFMELLD